MTSTVIIGESIGAFERETGFPTWNRYAAVNDEFVPIHMDDEAGRAAGYDAAFGMGNLQWSYMHNLLRTWLDGRGRIVQISCQFRRPNLKGNLRATGSVTSVTESDGGTIVDIDLNVTDATDTVTAPATARVILDPVTPTDTP